MAATKAELTRLESVLEGMRADSRPEVPNLDGFSVDWEDLAALEVLFNRLAAYAGYRAMAMRLRGQGDVEAALSHERCADEQYRKLPSWAKW